VTAQSILLLGSGGHAESCIDVIEQEGAFTIAGLVVPGAESRKTVLGYRVIGTDDDLTSLLGHCPNALVAVGQIESPEPRIDLHERLRQIGFHLPCIVSPHAYVSRYARPGEGTIVMHGAVINAGAIVGRNCIVNSQALVEHGAVVGDHCHVSTGARINGNARVGAGSFVGSGAVVREGVQIGEGTVIGMGQIVLGSCDAGTRIPGGRHA
jgi:sugar O-acyltransferase (sialic acid O-acetyltransferase NeuD family)